MTDAIKLLINIRGFRAFSREAMTLEQLHDALKKMNDVVSERMAEDEKIEASNKEYKEKLEAYRQMLIADGIVIEDLVIKKPKKPRAKYKFTDANGEEQTWTGQGRRPKSLAVKIDNGASLDDFLI